MIKRALSLISSSSNMHAPCIYRVLLAFQGYFTTTLPRCQFFFFLLFINRVFAWSLTRLLPFYCAWDRKLCVKWPFICGTMRDVIIFVPRSFRVGLTICLLVFDAGGLFDIQIRVSAGNQNLTGYGSTLAIVRVAHRI